MSERAREWGRAEVLRRLGALPGWVSVQARESAFTARVEVELGTSRLRDRAFLRDADRRGVMAQAHMLLADRPAGTAVLVRWV